MPEDQELQNAKTPTRESITFILGEDKGKDNRYYDMAEAYYRTNAKTKNDLLITNCRSLAAVMDYLQNHPTDNGRPWNEIRLIVHSNEWRGIGIPIREGGKRLDAKILKEALDDKHLTSLKIKEIDNFTKLIVNACGLGKNEKLVNLLGEVFGNCQVNTSEFFVMYDDINGTPRQYEAEYYYAFFKTGYRPADFQLAAQFKKRYPGVNINWMDALTRKHQRYVGDTYHYFFNIPVNWVVTYPTKEERPVLKNKIDQQNWLLQQKELMAQIEKTKIPWNKFRWQFQAKDYTFADGVTEPAIIVKGKSSVLCVLQSRE